MTHDRSGLDDSVDYLSPASPGSADAWTQKTGNRGSQVLRDVSEEAASGDVAEALGLPEGASVVVRRRTMLLDGDPVELTDSFYPASWANGTPLADKGKVRGGAPTVLAELGFSPAEALEDVTVTPATEGEAELLALPVGAPVLRVFRVVFTVAGSPFEVSKMAMVPEGRHLRYKVRVGE